LEGGVSAGCLGGVAAHHVQQLENSKQCENGKRGGGESTMTMGGH
jgi:hypothetical protein